jgi:chromosomal replication initiation ATPase DnaA
LEQLKELQESVVRLKKMKVQDEKLMMDVYVQTKTKCKSIETQCDPVLDEKSSKAVQKLRMQPEIPSNQKKKPTMANKYPKKTMKKAPSKLSFGKHP